MISLDNLKTVINAIKCLLTDYPKKKDIPTKLPNPNPLTFTGTVTGSYDGSAAVNIEIPESVEIDNETIVKTEDGKLKVNVSLPSPAINGSLLYGDTNNSKWSEIDANGGYGWKEVKEPIIYTSDMYDSAEKVYYTDEETGQQSVFLVKISDDIITLAEAKSICSLTMWHAGESVTYDFAEPPYSNYVAQFGTTGVSLMGIQVMSCSQEEDAKDLVGTEEPFIIPAGTWLQADIASSCSSAEIAHGTINKIEEVYAPSNSVILNMYTVRDDESFNENIRVKFYKGLTIITDNGYLIQSVSDSESSFTCAKSDGLLYKYTLTNGNWSSSEIFLQSSALVNEIQGSGSNTEIPSTHAIWQYVQSNGSKYIEKSSISTSVSQDDDQRVPSSKAVYDFVQSSIPIPESEIAKFSVDRYSAGSAEKFNEIFDAAITNKKFVIINDTFIYAGLMLSELSDGYTMRFVSFAESADQPPYNTDRTFDALYYSSNGTVKFIEDTLAVKSDIPSIYPSIIESDTKHPVSGSAVYNFVNGRVTKDSVIINSSTADSTKQFKITVDDSGTISATEVTT